MKLINLKIDEASYPEFNVINWFLDLKTKTFIIKLDGCFSRNYPLHYFSSSEIKINNWQNLILKEFNRPERTWFVTEIEKDELKNIHEFKVENSYIYLRGFTKQSNKRAELILKFCTWILRGKKSNILQYILL